MKTRADLHKELVSIMTGDSACAFTSEPNISKLQAEVAATLILDHLISEKGFSAEGHIRVSRLVTYSGPAAAVLSAIEHSIHGKRVGGLGREGPGVVIEAHTVSLEIATKPIHTEEL